MTQAQTQVFAMPTSYTEIFHALYDGYDAYDIANEIGSSTYQSDVDYVAGAITLSNIDNPTEENQQYVKGVLNDLTSGYSNEEIADNTGYDVDTINDIMAVFHELNNE